MRLVLATDPLTTASRLAARIGADLARTPIEAELALERRQRASRAAALAAEAHEALAIARELASADEERDRRLLDEGPLLRADASADDPELTIPAIRRAAAEVAAAEAELAHAEAERADAIAAANHAAARGAPSAARIDAERARAVAGELRAAAVHARAAQEAAGRRPKLAARDLDQMHRCARRLRLAEERAGSMGRRTGRLLVQAAGLGLILAALAPEASSIAVVVVLAFAPAVVAALWSARAASVARTRLAAARRAGVALVARLFPDLAAEPTEGALPADPLAVWEERVDAWQVHSRAAEAADDHLLDLQRQWRAIAGDLDSERLDQVLAARDDLAAADARLSEASAAVDRARLQRARALQAWQQALAAADLPAARPVELPSVVDVLEHRRRRRASAVEQLEGLAAAERRAERRRRLTQILAGRTVEELIAAADQARTTTSPEALTRPLVLADPLAALPHTRWAAIRRHLTELDGAACVLVTSEPEAATWGLAPLDG